MNAREGRHQRACSSIRSLRAWGASLSLFLLAAPLATQELFAFDDSAEQAISRAFAQGAFGPAAPQAAKGDLHITVNGRPAQGDGRIHLVEAGGRAELSATITFVGARELDQPTTGGIRQTSHQQIVWLGAEDDVFAPGPDNVVTWSAGSEGAGRAARLSVSAAIIDAGLPLESAVAPSEPQRVPVVTARGEFILLPGVSLDRAGDGMLHGQNIGIYPNEGSERAPGTVRDRVELYRPPASFYRLDEETGPAKITKHFTLRDINPPVFPEEEQDARFVAVSPRLVKYLEALEENLEQRGFPPQNIVVLRGFVSPTERLRLERFGERMAEFSRFQYGDAIAFVYDTRGRTTEAPNMSDLDGDGQTTIADADLLATIAKDTMDELQMFGGLGVGSRFGGNSPAAQSSYVHVDLRGFFSPFREE